MSAADLEGGVDLKGRINDVASELQAASIFVLPSYVEGNSNAVLEAMAAGLPVLSTRVGGTPLLVALARGRRNEVGAASSSPVFS